jgi:hypothetical protein
MLKYRRQHSTPWLPSPKTTTTTLFTSLTLLQESQTQVCPFPNHLWWLLNSTIVTAFEVTPFGPRKSSFTDVQLAASLWQRSFQFLYTTPDVLRANKRDEEFVMSQVIDLQTVSHKVGLRHVSFSVRDSLLSYGTLQAKLSDLSDLVHALPPPPPAENKVPPESKRTNQKSSVACGRRPSPQSQI